MSEPATLLRRSLPLGIRTAYPSPSPGVGYSAVLAALWNDAGDWKILFTLRGDSLADHRGQVAFPGGRAETGDSGPLQTALRETREEVGIPPEHIDPLGILDPVDTSTGFRIWPVVGIWKQPGALNPAPPEVCETFWIPLAWLGQAGRWKRKAAPSGRGRHRAIFFEAYQGRIVWGATALITVQLLQILPGGRIG
jgi:8-oxo-dGTP pyrophosphatase MutT (NUDIX family)